MAARNRRMRHAVAAAIARYQARGGRERFWVACHFEPSCSEYTRQAVLRFGAWRGLRLGWARVRRCTDRQRLEPIFDPVPETLSRRPSRVDEAIDAGQPPC